MIHIKDRTAPFRNMNQYIFIGQSGAGKDWCLDKVHKELGYPKLVSHTTRPPRPQEVDGVDYHFAAAFDPEKDDWVEYREYKTIDAIRSLVKRLRKKLPKDIIFTNLDQGYYIK